MCMYVYVFVLAPTGRSCCSRIASIMQQAFQLNLARPHGTSRCHPPDTLMTWDVVFWSFRTVCPVFPWQMWQVMMLSDPFLATRRIKWSSSCVESLLRTGMSSQHWFRRRQKHWFYPMSYMSFVPLTNLQNVAEETQTGPCFECRIPEVNCILNLVTANIESIDFTTISWGASATRGSSSASQPSTGRTEFGAGSFGLKQVESENTSLSFKISIMCA